MQDLLQAAFKSPSRSWYLFRVQTVLTWDCRQLRHNLLFHWVLCLCHYNDVKWRGVKRVLDFTSTRFLEAASCRGVNCHRSMVLTQAPCWQKHTGRVTTAPTGSAAPPAGHYQSLWCRSSVSQNICFCFSLNLHTWAQTDNGPPPFLHRAPRLKETLKDHKWDGHVISHHVASLFGFILTVCTHIVSFNWDSTPLPCVLVTRSGLIQSVNADHGFNSLLNLPSCDVTDYVNPPTAISELVKATANANINSYCCSTTKKCINCTNMGRLLFWK